METPLHRRSFKLLSGRAARSSASGLTLDTRGLAATLPQSGRSRPGGGRAQMEVAAILARELIVVASQKQHTHGLGASQHGLDSLAAVIGRLLSGGSSAASVLIRSLVGCALSVLAASVDRRSDQ